MGKSKKIILMMIFVLSMGLILPVHSQEKTMATQTNINKEEAIMIAQKALKNYLNMSVEDEKYTFRMENRRDWVDPNVSVWVLNWHYNDSVGYAYANVTVDVATGNILEMSSDKATYKEQRAKVTTITREEAQKKAEIFIQKILPDRLRQTVLREEAGGYHQSLRGGPNPLFYNFRYIRLYEGVKHDANSINVGVDGATGEIRNFHYRWDDRTNFPEKKNIKSLQEARKRFKDHINMELIYVPFQDPMKEQPTPKKAKLAYKVAQHFGNMMDAQTGKILDWEDPVKDSVMKIKDLTIQEKQNILKQWRTHQKKEKELHKEGAEKLALEMLEEHIGTNVKIEGIHYIEGKNNWDAAGRRAWNIEFSIENQGEETPPTTRGRTMIDAQTEELLAYSSGYNDFGYDQLSFEPALTWEEAYEKAIDIIAKYHGDKIDGIQTKQIYTPYTQVMNGKEIPPMEYYFNFPRMVEGVLYEDDQINISFNNRTGKLQNFHLRWNQEIDFPEKRQVISENEAKNILLQHNEVELAYAQWQDNRFPKGASSKIVYRLASQSPQINPYMLVDALSGKPIDYNGKTLLKEENKTFERVIENHWIEKNAKILAQQGILDLKGFEPDQPITKMNAVKMLVKAKGMDEDYMVTVDALKFSDIHQAEEGYAYVYLAVKNGLIDNKEGEFNPEDQVTREAFTMMLVKLLRYDPLAKAQDLFQLSFEDQDKISQEAIGSVAICQGLEILKYKNGSFRPKDAITMAEAVDMVYRALKYIER
ncbi:S-layer homology domain-containing protein [Clostridiaceae bacterium 35-E11]